MSSIIRIITVTDTGVVKSVMAAVLTQHLRERGVKVAALKPICSGDRNDARLLRAATGNGLTLDEVNPWHFRAPLSPLLAARKEQEKVTLKQVVAHARPIRKKYEVVIVEGAGGLLSPLGEGFDSRDLVTTLRATPIVVCPNRLGAVNQILLTLDALPTAAASRAQIVLMNPPRLDLAARTNPKLLAEFVGTGRIHSLDWLGKNPFAVATGKLPSVRKMLNHFVHAIAL